jgi:hypothetical protein
MGKQHRRRARENEEGEKSIFANSSALAKGPPRYSSVVFVLLRVVYASRFERRKSVTDATTFQSDVLSLSLSFSYAYVYSFEQFWIRRVLGNGFDRERTRVVDFIPIRWWFYYKRKCGNGRLDDDEIGPPTVVFVLVRGRRFRLWRASDESDRFSGETEPTIEKERVRANGRGFIGGGERDGCWEE